MSTCSMLKTLERYQKCNYGAPEANVATKEALVLVNHLTHTLFKTKYCTFFYDETYLCI